jgi:hypothetical protein
MSYQHLNADECIICGIYSNSGFDLCEDCAMDFTLYVHNNFLNKVLSKQKIEKEYESFKKLDYEERTKVKVQEELK